MKNLSAFKLTNVWMILLCAVSILATSCNEEEELVVITVDDAAELVAFSLANRTYGTIYTLNYVAEEVVDLLDCNESETNDRTLLDTSSDREISVSYTISESYSKSCEGIETVTYMFTTEQTLNSLRYDLEEKVTGDWSIAGVQDNSAEITYNGPYTRSGLWTYNLEENHTDDVIFSNTFMDVTYDPNVDRITGGTSTFLIEGTSTVYEPYSYEGEVEFLGSDLATITFQSGEVYELNLETGDITEL